MVTYADSSFLVSLYVNDAHTTRASTYLAKNPHSIFLTPFSQSETQHAFRMSTFRGIISEGELSRALFLFEQDQKDGLLEIIPIDSDLLFQKAAQLSHRYTLSHGVRYLDMLHIASAVLVNTNRFLTFDERQRRLAKSVGLAVKP